MSRYSLDYQEVAHLPLSERVAHFRALYLQDRLDGLRHRVEDYVCDVPEGERPAFLDELREAQRQLDEGATTGFAPSEDDDEADPSLIGRYQIQRILGRGAFGEVWEAFDPALQRAVAVKILRPDRHWSDEQVALFLEEGRKLARLKHPGIVAVYDVGRRGDGVFIVSELIAGDTLAQRIDRGAVARSAVPALLAQVADAAHHAHLHGILHRDIKPANVLMDAQGHPHLVDFGVALAEEEQRGARGAIAGTVAYMSPEQLRGESHLLDGRTDVYSIGVVMYELLTGRRPFQGKDRAEFREQILKREPRPPRSIDDSISRELEKICLKCLAKSVADRYVTAADLAEELRRAAANVPESTATFRTGVPERRWVWGAAAGGVVLLVACAALFAPLRTAPEQTPRDGRGAVTPVAADPASIQVKDLLRPAQRNTSSNIWKVIEEENALRVTTGIASLLQLATAPEDFELSIQLSQIQDTGRIGVFFGYREDNEKGQGRYQLIHLVNGAKGPQLQRVSRFFSLGAPLGSHAGENVGRDAPIQNLERNTLVLRVRDDRLTEVRFNGVRRPELTDGVPSRFDRCRGPLGAYNFRSDGLFARVVLDNIVRKFVPGQGG